MQTIQQQRASYALEKVGKAYKDLKDLKDSKTKIKEFKSYAAALPAMIHTSGLGQAAAFYKAKGGEHLHLYNLLSEWLTKPNQPYAGKEDLLEGITQENMHRYRLAQAESQALMDWIKQFASAYMAEA